MEKVVVDMEPWIDLAREAIKAGLIDPEVEMASELRAWEIADTRKKLKINQRDLARFIGKSQSQVSLWESDQMTPPLWLVAVVRALRSGLAVIPLKSLSPPSIRTLKLKYSEKLRGYGHWHKSWESDEAGGWIETCNHRIYLDPEDRTQWSLCTFAVHITNEREVIPGEMDDITGKMLPGVWRRCTGNKQ